MDLMLSEIVSRFYAIMVDVFIVVLGNIAMLEIIFNIRSYFKQNFVQMKV